MKIKTCLLALMFTACGTAHSANFYLSVKPGTTKRESENRFKTDNGSYIKDSSQVKTIAATVRNNDRIDQICIVEWFFVATSLEDKEEYIYDSGKAVVPLQAGKEKTLDIESKAVTGQERNAKFFNIKDKKGGKYDGYLVLVRTETQIIKVVCSKKSRTYEQKILQLAEEFKKAAAAEEKKAQGIQEKQKLQQKKNRKPWFPRRKKM